MKINKFPLLAFILAALWFVISANVSADMGEPMYPTSVDVLDDGNFVVTNRGTKDVRIYDASGKVVKTWDFTEPVTSVVADGERIYVASSYDAGYISCIDARKGNVVYKKPVGMGACALLLNKAKDKLYVANRYKGTVSEVETKTGKTLREVPVLREPCAMVLSPDGKYLFVNNFLPAQRADIDYVAADVSVIELGGFTKVKDIKLSNGSNALRGINISPDGKLVFVSHNLGRYQVPTSQLQQGWMNTSALSVIDAEKLEFIGSVLMDEADRGAAGIWDVAVEDNVIAVTHSGTHDVSVVDRTAFTDKLNAYADLEELENDLYFLRDIRERVPLNGNGPRAMKIKDGKLYIATFFSDTLNVVNLADNEVEAVALNPNRKSSRIDIGERAFNDATFCYQNWQSCNGCHPGEGRMDAMNWDLLNDGIGNPKNCKSLLYSHFTPPNMISGIRPNAEVAVRAGFIHIQFCNIEEEISNCVDEYVKSLQALPSPYLVDGKLSEKAEKGRLVFEKLKCDECHNGTYYTDMKMYRIGEDVEFDAGWDTPTLREVWRTAPYLFDGRAATMRDVFVEHKHGIEGDVSEQEMDELVEYVNSL